MENVRKNSLKNTHALKKCSCKTIYEVCIWASVIFTTENMLMNQ